LNSSLERDLSWRSNVRNSTLVTHRASRLAHKKDVVPSVVGPPTLSTSIVNQRLVPRSRGSFPATRGAPWGSREFLPARRSCYAPPNKKQRPRWCLGSLRGP